MIAKPASLASMATYVVTTNLSYWTNNDNYEFLEYLPNPLKDRIQSLFTSGSYFWRDHDFKKVFSCLINENTIRIDLTCINLDDELLTILNPCWKLKKACFTHIHQYQITREGLITFLKGKKDLLILRIPRCDVVDDEVLSVLVENSPRIAVLDVGYCQNITDVGIEKLASLKFLTCLSISSTQVTSRGVTVLVQSSFSYRLKELIINNCKNITQQALEVIAENCPYLEVFVFHNCFMNKGNSPLNIECSLKHLRQITWTVTW